MNIEIHMTASEEETFALGIDFSSRLVPGDVIAFYGELGVGKTEFVKGICHGLDVNEIVASPTFTIVNQYRGRNVEGEDVQISHIDLYRVDAADDIVELGLLEIINDQESITLIEWAQNAEMLLPGRRYDVCMYSTDDDTGRRIEILRRTPDEVAVAAAGRWSAGGNR